MPYADLIIENAALLTFADTPEPCNALAIKDEHILALGTRAQMYDLKGPDTRIIDAAGNTVLPGFIESHIHLFPGGFELGLLNLASCTSMDQVSQMVRAYAAQNPDQDLLYAIGGNYGMLGDGVSIDRHGLDQVMPNRPFAVLAADHHTVWANTAALHLAGIASGAKVSAGSQITMGADGLATGELLEPGAYEYILAKTSLGGRDMLGMTTGADPSPPASPQQRVADKNALRAGLKHLASFGITTFHNMDGNFYQLELLSELQAEGDLLCRGQIPFHLKAFDSIDRLDEADDMRRRYNSDWLWSGRLKLFHDGVCESGTAAMLQPYPNWPDSHGAPVFAPDQFRDICVRADKMGLQISVHAIGDAANRETLDAFEAARDANGARDSRHRIEHVEILHPDDVARFGHLGVIASMQPPHSPAAGLFPPPPKGMLLHEDQKPQMFRWDVLRAAAPRLIFSSDWPVVPVDVMAGVRAAVAPIKLDPPWVDHPQDLIATLKSYTADGAWAEFSEYRKGCLAPGMMADIAILSQDVTKIAPETLDQVKAKMTLCAGRPTHDTL
ncbi:MAG: amidohydrolase [Sedimentitalea sp.]